MNIYIEYLQCAVIKLTLRIPCGRNINRKFHWNLNIYPSPSNVCMYVALSILVTPKFLHWKTYYLETLKLLLQKVLVGPHSQLVLNPPPVPSFPSRFGVGRTALISPILQKREIPWEKVPFVPRPSLVPDPITAFGKKKPEQPVKQERKSILSPEERAKIKPKAYLEPVKPYVSAREQTKEKVFTGILRNINQPNAESMDYVLPRLHRVAECPDLPYKRRIVSSSDLPPVW